MMNIFKLYCQVLILSTLAVISFAQFKEGIGYIGPACAVVVSYFTLVNHFIYSKRIMNFVYF